MSKGTVKFFNESKDLDLLKTVDQIKNTLYTYLV